MSTDPQVFEFWLVRFKGAAALTEVRIEKVYGRAFGLNPRSAYAAAGIYERGKDFEFVEKVCE